MNLRDSDGIAAAPTMRDELGAWLPADAGEPCTATVTRRSKPGHDAAYEQFLAGISGAAKVFPGDLGQGAFRPASGQSHQVRIGYRLDTSAQLRGWVDSEERAAWLARAEPQSPARCGPGSSPPRHHAAGGHHRNTWRAGRRKGTRARRSCRHGTKRKRTCPDRILGIGSGAALQSRSLRFLPKATLKDCQFVED